MPVSTLENHPEAHNVRRDRVIRIEVRTEILIFAVL